MNIFGMTGNVEIVSSLCNFTYDTHHKTAVIVGTSQSGTSMVAAVAHTLGCTFVNHDSDLCSGNFERPWRPCVSQSKDEWFACVVDVNSRFDVWGFKDPTIFRFNPCDVQRALRNPYYLIVTKDIMSTVQRRLQDTPSTPASIQQCVLDVNRNLRDMWDWVYGLPPSPQLGISYQRAVANPAAFVDGVAAFLNITPTPEIRSTTIDRISTTGGYWLRNDLNGDD